MDSKRCRKCEVVKDIDCFSNRKVAPDGRNPRCRKCCRDAAIIYRENNKEKISADQRMHYKKNREYIINKSKKYYHDNKEKVAIRGKVYRENNKERIRNASKIYEENNKDRLAEYKRNYRISNKDRLDAYYKIYQENNKDKLDEYKRNYRLSNKDISHKNYIDTKDNPSKSITLFNHIPITDAPKLDIEGYITVKCKMCGSRYRPLLANIANRTRCVNNAGRGESNFYCTDACADACPLFRFNPNSIDPRSILHIPKSDQEEARRCQTNHLKILQVDEFGYNFCEKCGTEVDTVELHHTLPIASFGLEAINSAGHLLVCNECHKEFTKDCKI